MKNLPTTTRETFSQKQYKPDLAMRLALARSTDLPKQIGMSSKLSFVSHVGFIHYDR